MKKLTKIQLLTLFAFVAYAVYEFYFVKKWALSQSSGGAIIRVDLIVIYLALALLVGISLYQRRENK